MNQDGSRPGPTAAGGDLVRVVPARLNAVADTVDRVAGGLTALGRDERQAGSAEDTAGSLPGWRLQGALRDTSRIWHSQLDTLTRQVNEAAAALRANATRYTRTEHANDQLMRGQH